MLSITPDGPGRYTARNGETVLGGCVWRAEGDTTVVESVWLADESDAALLDGLIRTALFAGERVGRSHGEISPAVEARFADLLHALGLPLTRTALEDLPRKCGCNTEKHV